MPETSGRRVAIAVGALLALLTLVAYARVAENGFIGFDDNEYVYQNLQVQAGLSWGGLVWAFTTDRLANWHPLTWLLYMLDFELFGLRAWGHHLTNLAFHVANALLLFHLLRRTTSALWPSAFVAATLALHPLHVESVAWIAELKDVASTFFWLLTTLAYVRWVERPGARRYATVLVLYAVGLLTKPMLVTLPFTLLLLDLWPLRRIESPWSDARAFARLAREKAPLFALAAASSVITYLVQRSGGAMTLGDSLPLGFRVQNALVAYVVYLWKSIAPFRLTVFYPYPAEALPIGAVVLAALGIVGTTALALRTIRAWPWLAVGWLWFLGTLVPVIGILQVGPQWMADRYTYVPMIGASIAVAFGAAEIVRRIPGMLAPVAAVAAVLVFGWTALTWKQVGIWRNDATLFGHALEVLPENYLAHGVLGVGHLSAGRLPEAESELRESLRIRPSFALGHCNLGAALERLGRPEEAEREYETALRLAPHLAEAHQNLGRLLGMQGRTDLAIEHLETALRSSPESVDAHFNLGVALLNAQRIEEGIAHLERALELKPDYEDARKALDRARGLRGAERGPRRL